MFKIPWGSLPLIKTEDSYGSKSLKGQIGRNLDLYAYIFFSRYTRLFYQIHVGYNILYLISINFHITILFL